MSKILINELYKIRATEYDKEKEARKEIRKQQLLEKMESLILKYFDPGNEKSVSRSIERAYARNNKNSKDIVLFINFDRDDFLRWSKFVPFKPDPLNGFNMNARATECCHRFLMYSKEKQHLPFNIEFDVWKNKKFTVKFTIKNV